MEKQKCQRCNTEEYIPTHQYIKYEGKLNYVCVSCWDVFHGWLNKVALKESKPNPGKVHSYGFISGEDPSFELKTGRDPTKAVTLKLILKERFHNWFAAKSTLEKRIE